jgi:hypothetical protein
MGVPIASAKKQAELDSAMFELQPPGSFPLCRDRALQATAANDLKKIATAVREAMRPLPTLGLILTGSVARGEGTLIADPEIGSRWLGDIECHLVFNDKRGAPVAEIDHNLLELERRLNGDSENRCRGMRIGLKAIGVSRLARLRPAIFTREMLEHGKLLWGEPAALPQPSWWTAGLREIPLRDAFRLLNNRIVQQVEARMRREAGSGAPLSSEYALNKFWIDLATSLSVFLDCYRSSYRERKDALESRLRENSGPLTPENAQLLIARLRDAMAVKEGRPPAEIHSDDSFAEAAQVASAVWYWEAGRLAGSASEPADWKSILPLLRRIDTASQRGRDWARLLLRRHALRELRPGLVGILRIATRAGSLANAIYGAGSMLEFFWRDIDANNVVGCSVATTLAALFNLQNDSASGNRVALATTVLRAWDSHLRFAPA